MHSRVTSGFLYAQPSFWSGVARLLDWYGTYDTYNWSCTAREADYKALLSDWRAVGRDIQDAMASFEDSLTPEQRDVSQYELFAGR